MKCHLVYRVPVCGPNQKMASLSRKIRSALQEIGLPISVIGDRGKVRVDGWPEISPFSITSHLYRDLSSRMTTLLYDLREKKAISFSGDDIFIGHPLFPFRRGMKGVTELSLQNGISPKVSALITPLHCDISVKTDHINKDYLDSVDRLMDKADILFSIMGEYWWDRWDSSIYAHWKRKMVRLDMAIDPSVFPRIKKEFNPPGKRRYLYIGRNDPMKGVELLTSLMAGRKARHCGWIGPGSDIPGIERVSGPRYLTSEFMREVAERYDFFITTGIADPNPTTILESMAWGFPVVCTPQSGYYETAYMKNIFHDDMRRNDDVLEELQYMDEKKLKNIAEEARAAVEKKYTWKNFTRLVGDSLDSVIRRKIG